MSNYPDGLSEGTPGAPWNQEPATCARCRDELDGDACEQENVAWDDAGYAFDQIGWPGGLCSTCADADYEKHGCSCDEGVFCSLTCFDKNEAETRAVEESVRRNPASWTGGDSRGEHDLTL